MLTAKDEVADRVTGLDAGADDYLVKPFSLERFIVAVDKAIERLNASERKTLMKNANEENYNYRLCQPLAIHDF